jgi:hypothetical protein
VGAAKLGGGRIFATTRRADQREFAEMTAVLAGAARRACTGGVKRILFPNRDATIAYLGLANDRLGGCEAVHETSVTPFSDPELAGCDFVLVSALVRPYDAVTAEPMQEVEQWRSRSGRFGFTLYRNQCGARP